MDSPSKMSANEILKKHGPAGWFVRRLQQYAILGWVLFFIVLGMFFLTTLFRSLAAQPVVVVDESGGILGALEYLKPSTRSDQEIKAASMRFAHNFMSLNSDTVFEDYAEAMNMMGPELLELSRQTVNQDNYLARVANAKSRSWLEFAASDGVVIIDRRNLNAQVRLRGNIIVEGIGGRVSKPFDMTIETEAVARSTNNTSGLKILSRKDN
jgi:hypothetical protein